MNSAARRMDDDRYPHSNDPARAFASDITSLVARNGANAGHQREPDRAFADNVDVRRETTARADGAIVHRSQAIRTVLDQIHLVAPTTATVLLLGETGVGKEVFAQVIHDASPRRRRQMIRVSCAAIPTTLIESELFGHEPGAFTDARSRKIGRFEAANGSTLFLDEIGELSLEMQVKLLRVLEERTIERLGCSRSISLDVRIIAATNRDLTQAVEDGRFREDLFYRLNVFPITIPPLRERVADIAGLVRTFIDELAPAVGKHIEGVTSQSLIELQRYPWPGNVRELRNLIEREIILAHGPLLAPTIPRTRLVEGRACSVRLDDVQAEHIRSVLESCGWRVRGQNAAAERLGMKPTTLETRMAKLGIRRNTAP
jgi:formate hydrogenlyase transcriptional activator